MRIGFLASHGGSVARAVIAAAKHGELKIEVGPLITNNRDAQIFPWCESNGIVVHHISQRTHPDEGVRDRAISSVLSRSATDYVVLSGYMKKIGPVTLDAFQNRILNVHPALLPRYGGKGMFGDQVHEAVLASKDTVSGATIHFLNEEYDEGPIIAQESVGIEPGESVDTLKKKIQALEEALFLKVIRILSENA